MGSSIYVCLYMCLHVNVNSNMKKTSHIALDDWLVSQSLSGAGRTAFPGAQWLAPVTAGCGAGSAELPFPDTFYCGLLRQGEPTCPHFTMEGELSENEDLGRSRIMVMVPKFGSSL